jgi:predicted RNA-binding Zn ribbon-like protein
MLMTLVEPVSGVNVVFADDTEEALGAAVALVNTAGRGEERLGDVAALDAFFTAYGWTGRHERTEEELCSVQALRGKLRRVWYVGEDEVVDIVNVLLHDANAQPYLVKHDGRPYHLHATPFDAPLADRMAVEAAMAIVDIVREGELSRLRICEYPDCGNVVIDLSKNRSKRFCDNGCGNRAAVAAYRARKAGGAAPSNTTT